MPGGSKSILLLLRWPPPPHPCGLTLLCCFCARGRPFSRLFNNQPKRRGSQGRATPGLLSGRLNRGASFQAVNTTRTDTAPFCWGICSPARLFCARALARPLIRRDHTQNLRGGVGNLVNEFCPPDWSRIGVWGRRKSCQSRQITDTRSSTTFVLCPGPQQQQRDRSLVCQMRPKSRGPLLAPPRPFGPFECPITG